MVSYFGDELIDCYIIQGARAFTTFILYDASRQGDFVLSYGLINGEVGRRLRYNFSQTWDSPLLVGFVYD